MLTYFHSCLLRQRPLGDSVGILSLFPRSQCQAMPRVGARYKLMQKAKGHWGKKNRLCKSASPMSLQQNNVKLMLKKTKVNYLASSKHQCDKNSQQTLLIVLTTWAPVSSTDLERTSVSPLGSDFLIHSLYLTSLNLVTPRDLVLLVSAQQLIFSLGRLRKCLSTSFHPTFPESFTRCNSSFQALMLTSKDICQLVTHCTGQTTTRMHMC